MFSRHYFWSAVSRLQSGFARSLPFPYSSVRSSASYAIKDMKYEDWLSGPGEQFKDSKVGPNWLGQDRPFPLNSTFKPPPPLGTKTRDMVYQFYMSNPSKYNVRRLSKMFGQSLKRIDAILRLKGLEESWKEGKQLQTGFAACMERVLGAIDQPLDSIPEQRRNVTDADLQDQSEIDNRARDRYQRLFWEPAIGEESIVQGSLEEAKKQAEVARLQFTEEKASEKLLSGRDFEGKARMADPVIVSGQSGRPAVLFKDVGAKFLDVQDRKRRIREAGRRRLKKLRRSAL